MNFSGLGLLVINNSRHEFNDDQVRALRANGFDPEEQARSPFFNDAQDLADEIAHRVTHTIFPGDLLLECWADGLIPDGTVLIKWRADDAARARGRFAARGLVMFEWRDGRPVVVLDDAIQPTVEVDLRTGEQFEYQGG